MLILFLWNDNLLIKEEKKMKNFSLNLKLSGVIMTLIIYNTI